VVQDAPDADAFNRPYGTWEKGSITIPSDESLGYFHQPRRGWTLLAGGTTM
jgi:hypothetical protein